MESKVTRRGLFSAMVTGAVLTALDPLEAEAQESVPSTDEDVEVTVKIVWLMDGTPVDNAIIFDHKDNKEIGKTDKEGLFQTILKDGTVLRLVEPNYGQQQAIRVVQGERIPQKSIRISRVGEGWTWT